MPEGVQSVHDAQLAFVGPGPVQIHDGLYEREAQGRRALGAAGWIRAVKAPMTPRGKCSAAMPVPCPDYHCSLVALIDGNLDRPPAGV